MAKAKQHYTPIGVFKYCHLNKPDTRYKEEGEYSVTVLLDKADAGTKAILATLDKMHKQAYEDGCEKMEETNAKQKAKWKQKKITKPTLNPYYADEVDEDGDPTGRIELRMKTKASFTDRDGNSQKKTVGLVDAKGVMIPAKKRPLVYAGTEGRVAFAAAASFIPKDADVYLSLYLNQVQITNLVSGGGGTSAFGAVEGADFDSSDLDEWDGKDDEEDDEDQDDGPELDDDEIPF